VIEIPKVPRENGRQWQNLKHLVFCLVSCLASAMAVHIYDNAVMATGESMPEIKSLSDPDPNAPWPRVAWLMSFPNSVRAMIWCALARRPTNQSSNEKLTSSLLSIFRAQRLPSTW
jgi:hypothetical protein